MHYATKQCCPRKHTCTNVGSAHKAGCAQRTLSKGQCNQMAKYPTQIKTKRTHPRGPVNGLSAVWPKGYYRCYSILTATCLSAFKVQVLSSNLVAMPLVEKRDRSPRLIVFIIFISFIVRSDNTRF